MFNEEGYEIMRGVVSRKLLDSTVADFDLHELTMNTTRPGPKGDSQVSNSFSVNSPAYAQYLNQSLESLIEDKINIRLTNTGSYARIYYKNAVLKKHKDRAIYRISATVCIKKETDWPIWIETLTGETTPVELEEGDLMVYEGSKLFHWRDAYQGNRHHQVFLHYSTVTKS